MPADRRLPDGRGAHHRRLPAARPPRHPHGRPGVARRRLRRGRAARLRLSLLAPSRTSVSPPIHCVSCDFDRRLWFSRRPCRGNCGAHGERGRRRQSGCFCADPLLLLLGGFGRASPAGAASDRLKREARAEVAPAFASAPAITVVQPSHQRRIRRRLSRNGKGICRFRRSRCSTGVRSGGRNDSGRLPEVFGVLRRSSGIVRAETLLHDGGGLGRRRFLLRAGEGAGSRRRDRAAGRERLRHRPREFAGTRRSAEPARAEPPRRRRDAGADAVLWRGSRDRRRVGGACPFGCTAGRSDAGRRSAGPSGDRRDTRVGSGRCRCGSGRRRGRHHAGAASAAERAEAEYADQHPAGPRCRRRPAGGRAGLGGSAGASAAAAGGRCRRRSAAERGGAGAHGGAGAADPAGTAGGGARRAGSCTDNCAGGSGRCGRGLPDARAGHRSRRRFRAQRGGADRRRPLHHRDEVQGTPPAVGHPAGHQRQAGAALGGDARRRGRGVRQCRLCAEDLWRHADLRGDRRQAQPGRHRPEPQFLRRRDRLLQDRGFRFPALHGPLQAGIRPGAADHRAAQQP